MLRSGSIIVTTKGAFAKERFLAKDKVTELPRPALGLIKFRVSTGVPAGVLGAAIGCGFISSRRRHRSCWKHWKRVQATVQNRNSLKQMTLAASGPEATVETKPFGSWESPITAAFVTAAGVGLGSLKCHPDNTLYWLEGRPEEQGRQVVCRHAPHDEAASERGGVDFIPGDHNARTRVHEYGGAAHLLGPNGDGVIYSNFADQRLYWMKEDGSVMPLTPPEDPETQRPGAPRFRFADGVLDIERNSVICVREDHTNPEPANVVNEICAVPLDGSFKIEVITGGHDFYAAPRLSPDGSKLAYICWDHPNMPWDETELCVAQLSDEGQALGTRKICGGTGCGTSVLQPAWSPEGLLYYVADGNGWWNLFQCSGDGEKPSEPNCLISKAADFSGPAPGWGLGGQNYCFIQDGRLATCYKNAETGMSRLVLLSSDGTGEEFGQECLPAEVGGMCASPDGKVLYFLGGSPDKPSGIYKWSLPKDGAQAAQAEMIVCSMRKDMVIDAAYVSVPRPISFPTAGGEVAHGYFYAPNNPRFAAPEGTAPPLLVRAHGGPTACTGTSLRLGMQFWTSRGFAVLDVDYRGSTGYGREYRERLKGNWGVVDVEDVCAGAEYLVKEGLVNPKQLAIDGGSAGGFTTLAALTFRDVFTAGCSLYGVPDLAALAGDTHKFESRYLDGLVGKYPEDESVFKARAPICNLEQLACPILLLQGAEDRIVPKNQAETMYEAVKSRGLPCAMKIYEGEQHGFRQSANIQDALNSELSFFATVFGFEAAGDDIPRLEIANLPPQA